MHGHTVGWRDHRIMQGRSPYGQTPSPFYNAGTEHVGFSPTRQIFLAPSTKRLDMLGVFFLGGEGGAGVMGELAWCWGGGWNNDRERDLLELQLSSCCG